MTINWIVQDERTVDTTYTNNVESMLAYIYHSAMWTAIKK
jgi:carnosine N-methyltransferase